MGRLLCFILLPAPVFSATGGRGNRTLVLDGDLPEELKKQVFRDQL
ncbi:MAG TPA: hypothetical protein VN918_00485 [Myxococcaceae bacterium]|nr:hypothetical protein [Myxococcaceae bacterium]